jgi:BON domain
MKHIVSAFVLVAGLAAAGPVLALQQQNLPEISSSESSTTVFPPAEFSSSQSSPARNLRPSDDLTAPEVRQLIHDSMALEPTLTGSTILVATDDRSVVLSGAVDNDTQRDLAVRIAKFYAGRRNVVSKIKVRPTIGMRAPTKNKKS